MKALIVFDRYRMRDRLINLGDRALVEGLYILLKKNGIAPISGHWKSFPYFSCACYCKERTKKSVQEVFDGWVARIQNFSPVCARIEALGYHLFNIIDVCLFPLNYFLYRQYSRRLCEFFSPFLFRNYFSWQMIENIKAVDVVICNGAGLLADHLKNYTFWVLVECYLAHCMGKPVITVNQTVALTNSHCREAVQFVYPLLRSHGTRESLSRKALIDMGVDESLVSAVPDTAFVSVQNPVVRKERSASRVVGVTIRGDLEQPYDVWCNIVNYITQTLKMDVRFVHTCYAHDAKICRRLKSLCELQERHCADVSSAVAEYSQCAFVITDRYHAAIFSLLAEIPFVPVKATTWKLDGLVELLHLNTSPVAIHEENAEDELRSYIHSISENYEDVQSRYVAAKREALKAVVQQYDNLFSSVVKSNGEGNA